MSDDYSPRLALPFLVPGQAQKELFHNEALARLDALVQPVAQSADLAAPPGSPIAGQAWIVPAGATGDWTGQDGAIARFSGGGWLFLSPAEGWSAWVVNRERAMIFDGSDWADAPVGVDGYRVAGVQVVGAQQPAVSDPTGGATIDSQARTAIAAILAVMRAHGLIAP